MTHVLDAESLRELALGVLHFVSLVHHDVLPVEPVELGLIHENVFVGCQTDVELSRAENGRDLLSVCWLALVDDTFDGRRPLFELDVPVGQCCQRDYY